MCCNSCHVFTVNHPYTHTVRTCRNGCQFIPCAYIHRGVLTVSRVFAWVGLSLFFCSDVCFDRGSCAAGICALREDITELRSGVVRDMQTCRKKQLHVIIEVVTHSIQDWTYSSTPILWNGFACSSVSLLRLRDSAVSAWKSIQFNYISVLRPHLDTPFICVVVIGLRDVTPLLHAVTLSLWMKAVKVMFKNEKMIQ